MLTTALEPYNGIADLFVVDPDGYVIRKWQSKVYIECDQILCKFHQKLLSVTR